MKSSKNYLITAFLMLISFCIFTYIVKIGKLNPYDYLVTLIIQKYLGHIFDLPFSILSLIGTFEVTVLIWLIFGVYLICKKYYLTFLTFQLFFVGLIIELLGKLVIFHQQPSNQFYRGVINISLPSREVTKSFITNSYPSGHIFRTTFLIIVIIFLIRKSDIKYKNIIQFILILLLILMIVSRVYLGEHWISDVIGGLFLGLGLALISVYTLSFSNKSKINTD